MPPYRSGPGGSITKAQLKTSTRNRFLWAAFLLEWLTPIIETAAKRPQNRSFYFFSRLKRSLELKKLTFCSLKDGHNRKEIEISWKSCEKWRLTDLGTWIRFDKVLHFSTKTSNLLVSRGTIEQLQPSSKTTITTAADTRHKKNLSWLKNISFIYNGEKSNYFDCFLFIFAWKIDLKIRILSHVF